MLKIKDYNLFILFLLWVTIQVCLLSLYGIKTDGEAENVITNANSLAVNGYFSNSRAYLYFTEIFLVFIKIKFDLGYGFIIIIHLALNFVALYCMYQLMCTFYSSARLALIGAILIIFCYPYQLYNGYLATESLYFSIGIFYSSYLLQTAEFTFKRTTVLFLLLVLVCFTRPSGLFFFAATVIYLFFFSARDLTLLVRIGLLGLSTAIGIVMVNYFTKSGNGYDFLIPFKEEHLICGVTSMPGVVESKMSGYNSLSSFANYLLQHPEQFFRLALLKSKVFFGLVRTHYSFGHNLFLIVFFYPIYLLSIGTLMRYRKYIPLEIIYCFSFFFIYWLSVIFSCDDWGNRFFLTLTPYLVLVALYLFKNKDKANYPTKVKTQ
jgi:hypothetical protein